jgi:hypothetical protein
MSWVYRILMALSVVGGAAISCGKISASWAAVIASLGTAAGFFHPQFDTTNRKGIES